MYFLSKFCRICVQTDVQLNDIEMLDFDSIKLRQKLESCSNLAVTKDTIPFEICKTCTNKLRVSYHFQEMCKKSTSIIRNYLSKLTEYSEKPADEPFENWDLEVSVTPLPRMGIVSVPNQTRKISEGSSQSKQSFENDQNVEDLQILDLDKELSDVDIKEESLIPKTSQKEANARKPIYTEVVKLRNYIGPKKYKYRELITTETSQEKNKTFGLDCNSQSSQQIIYKHKAFTSEYSQSSQQNFQKNKALTSENLQSSQECFQNSQSFQQSCQKVLSSEYSQSSQQSCQINTALTPDNLQYSQQMSQKYKSLSSEYLQSPQQSCQKNTIHEQKRKEKKIDYRDFIKGPINPTVGKDKNSIYLAEWSQPKHTETFKVAKVPSPVLDPLDPLDMPPKVSTSTTNFSQVASEARDRIDPSVKIKTEPTSKLRVKNFENEPIQNETEPNHNQNVLSEMEKVVNDVPTSFKKQQKPRITKEKRCTLLKQLLQTSKNHKKERDKGVDDGGSSSQTKHEGLKNIIDFTENYEFQDKNLEVEHTNHIDKLIKFSQNYFKRKSFLEFKNTVVDIIEHKDDYCYDSCLEDSDYDDELTESADETHDEMNSEMECEDSQSTFDYVVEANSEDDELGLVMSDDEEPLDDADTPTAPHPSSTPKDRTDSISDRITVKQEPGKEKIDPSNMDFRVQPEFVHLSEIEGFASSLKGECSSSSEDKGPSPGPSTYTSEFEMYLNKYTSQSVNMLDQLVSNYPMGGKKMFSPLSVRCRTRNQPYISPQLLDQFKLQCFRCEKCNRNFKSPGYLKAHTSKVH